MAMLDYFLIALVVPMVSSKSFGGQYYNTPNDTQTCVNDLVAWCDGMKYPTEGGSISMVSVTIADRRGYCQAACTADSDGTNCTKNGSPWFGCSNQNKLVYKGNALAKDSIEGSDNETCKTAENAFNDLFVQNLTYDNTTMTREFEKGMETFVGAMNRMEEHLANIQKKLSAMFGNGFPFHNRYPNNPYGYNTSNRDQREKE